MSDQNTTNTAQPLTPLEFAQLQLANSVSEWNSVLQGILDAREGKYPSDYSEKITTKLESNAFSIAYDKIILFAGGGYHNKYYTIYYTASLPTQCDIEELEQILIDAETENLQEKSIRKPYSPLPLVENAKLGIADKTILEYWLRNDPTKIPEYLRKYVPRKENDEGGEDDELSRRVR